MTSLVAKSPQGKTRQPVLVARSDEYYRITVQQLAPDFAAGSPDNCFVSTSLGLVVSARPDSRSSDRAYRAHIYTFFACR
jgi:hypothetical protein